MRKSLFEINVNGFCVVENRERQFLGRTYACRPSMRLDKEYGFWRAFVLTYRHEYAMKRIRRSKELRTLLTSLAVKKANFQLEYAIIGICIFAFIIGICCRLSPVFYILLLLIALPACLRIFEQIPVATVWAQILDSSGLRYPDLTDK